MRRFIRLGSLWLLWLCLATPPMSLAQGCASCKDNANAAPPALQQGLRHGILALLVPAGAGFALFAVWLLRRARVESASGDPLPPRV